MKSAQSELLVYDILALTPEEDEHGMKIVNMGTIVLSRRVSSSISYAWIWRFSEMAGKSFSSRSYARVEE